MLMVSCLNNDPDSKVHGANMRPIWVLSAPAGPHLGPMNLAIRGGDHFQFNINNNKDIDDAFVDITVVASASITGIIEATYILQ